VKNILMISLILITLTAFRSPDQQMGISGDYVNQSGSLMTISADKSGKLVGSYTTALGCGKGIVRPLQGWINGNAITFNVHFGECGSVTSWVGHVTPEGTIDTIWTLARGAETGWSTKLTGTSEFRPKSN